MPAKPRTPGAGARSCNRAPPRRGRRAEASALGPGGQGGAEARRDSSGRTPREEGAPLAEPGEGLRPPAGRMRAAERLPLPPRPPLPPPPPPPLPPRLSSLLLASGELKLGGWQQTGSARGPSSSASRPRTHRCAAHTSRRLGKMLPLIPSGAK